MLATEKEELESYIEECEENQKLNALREDSTNTAIELAFNEILNNFKESLNKKEELSELVNTQNQRKHALEI